MNKNTKNILIKHIPSNSPPVGAKTQRNQPQIYPTPTPTRTHHTPSTSLSLPSLPGDRPSHPLEGRIGNLERYEAKQRSRTRRNPVTAVSQNKGLPGHPKVPCFLEVFCYIKPTKKHGTFGGPGSHPNTFKEVLFARF